MGNLAVKGDEMRRVLIAAMLVMTTGAARAQQPRCSAPPPGDRCAEAVFNACQLRLRGDEIHARTWDMVVMRCQQNAAQASEQQRRMAQQQALLQQADNARQQQQEQAVKLAADPVAQRLAWSANLCGALDMKAKQIAGIAQEKKYARYGGVVDATKIKGFQDWIRAADIRTERSKAALKQLKVKPLSCKDAKVAAIGNCIENFPGCDDPDGVAGLLPDQSADDGD